MARFARIVVPGLPHHVTQRGNRQQRVFGSEAAYQEYLQRCADAFAKRGLRVWAYCLMSNHVHHIVVPETAAALGQALRDAHTAVSMAYNRLAGVSGHLWQGRFFSCVLDTEHLWAAVRYVERNAVRAGLVARAVDYPWSSAAFHCGLRADPLCDPTFPGDDFFGDWASWLTTEEDTLSIRIRQQTHTGRPCGSEAFCSDLAARLGRVVTPQRRGRKLKQRSDEAGN